MVDDVPLAKPVKFKADGTPDGRGHAEGSKPSRFGSGDGRTRSGRPKGSRSEKSDVLMVRDMAISLTVGGKTRKVTTRQAMLLKQRDKMLKGDQKATEFLARLFSQYEPPAVEPDLTAALLEEDLAILRSAEERRATQASPAALSSPVDQPDAPGNKGRQ